MIISKLVDSEYKNTPCRMLPDSIVLGEQTLQLRRIILGHKFIFLSFIISYSQIQTY